MTDNSISQKTNNIFKSIILAPLRSMQNFLSDRISSAFALLAPTLIAIIFLLYSDVILITLFPTSGHIYVGTPQIYTRERLVEDRYIQDAWIRKQLEEHSPENRIPAPLKVKKAQNSEKGDSIQSSFSTRVKISALSELDDKLAVRNRLRTLLRENRLDDRHDIEGSTLYLLKFSITIAPGTRTSAAARLRVAIDGQSVGDSVGSISDDRPGYDVLSGDEKGQRSLVTSALDRWANSLNVRIENTRRNFVNSFSIGAENAKPNKKILFKVIEIFDGNSYDCEEYWRNMLENRDQDEQINWPKASTPDNNVANLIDGSNYKEEDFIEKIKKLQISSYGLYNSIDAKRDHGAFLNCVSMPEILEKVFKFDHSSSSGLGETSPLFRYFQLKYNQKSPRPIFVEEIKDTLASVEPWRVFKSDSKYNYCENKQKQIWLNKNEAIKKCQENEYDVVSIDNCNENQKCGETKRSKSFCVDRRQYKKLNEYITGLSLGVNEYDLVSWWLTKHGSRYMSSIGSSQPKPEANLPKWWCEWSLNLRYGAENFFRDTQRNLRLFTYAVYPRNVTQQITFADEMRLKISRSIQAGRTNSIEGSIAEGQLVSFINSSEEIKKEKPTRASFGWLIYPTRDTKGIRRQQPATYDVSALISVPAWMQEIEINLLTDWLGKSGTSQGEAKEEKYWVNVPGDIDEVMRIAEPTGNRRIVVNIDKMNKMPIEATACTRGSIVIFGHRLWRGAVVTLGGQVADEIRVLPDMLGIVAKFDNIEIPAQFNRGANEDSETVEKLKVPIWIWTSEDSVLAASNAIIKVPKDASATCN